MRASSKCFITDERHLDRGRRLNLVWHHLQGKAGIAGDTPNTSHTVSAVADRDMILTGANVTSATSAAEVEGGKTYAVVTGTVGAAVLEPNTLVNGSPWTEIDWETDQEPEWEAHIRMDDDFTSNRLFKYGLGLTPSTVNLTTDDDYVGFWHESDGDFDWVYRAGTGNDIISAAVHTLLLGELVHLALKFDKNQQVHAYINGNPVDAIAAASTPSWQGNSTALLLPFIATLEATTGGADPKISVLGMAMSKRIE